MKELAEYHNLTHLSEDELKGNIKLKDIVNKLDFHSPEKVHAKNFDHFISFLEKNGLDYIYNYGYYQHPPLDKKIEEINLPKMLTSINTLEPIELSNRLIKYNKLQEKIKLNLKKEKKLSQEVLEYKKEIKRDKEIIKRLNQQLKRKSVKIGLRFGDSLAIAKKVKK